MGCSDKQGRIAQQHGEEKDITLETLERAVGCSDKAGLPNDTTKRRKLHSRHWKGLWVVQTNLDCPTTPQREGNYTRDIGKGCGLFRQNWIAQQHHEEKEITLETLERVVGCSDKTGSPSNTAKRKNHTRDIEKGCGLFRQDRIAQ